MITASIACGNSFKPSTHAIRDILNAPFFNPFMIESQNFAL